MPIGGPFRRRLTTSTLGVDYFWTPIMAYFSAPIDRSYARKPRGGPAGLGREHAERFSFCCAVDDCRKRATPPSLRFLGRHVYLATVVTLISAMQLGITPSRLARLSVVPGLDRRALARLVAFHLHRQPLRAGCDGRRGAPDRHRGTAGLAARAVRRRRGREAH